MENTPQKILGMRDIAVLTFISNFGLRWLAVAAAIGASAISFWIMGAIFLAYPLAYMCAKLSKLYPEEGGLYAWTRNVLGEKNGFIVAWLYFINNLFYYPAILIFLATNFAYFLGKPALANNSDFVCTVVLISFWLVVLMSLYGLKVNKFLTEYAGLVGTIIPVILIIALGFGIYFYTKHSATLFTWHTILPNDHITHNLANLTMIMFAITGVEIIPTFANAVKNPKRDLYFGLLIGVIVMIAVYIIGTLAINIILSPDDIRKTSGLIHALQLISLKLHMLWMTKTVALMLVFAEFAAVSIWLIAPITMFFKCTPAGLLPNWLHQTNQKEAPANAILFVGFIVTVIMLTTQFLPAVNDMYQILVLMSVLLAFIPYLFLVVVFMKSKHKITGNHFMHSLFSLFAFISLILGIIFSFQLPHNLTTIESKVFYEAELFFGPLIFIFVGYRIFARWQKRMRSC